MGTLAKVALFRRERLLSFGFVCFLCFFLFAFPLVIAFQIAFYKILVAYLRDFGRHAYIAREKLALAASCLACGYTCFLLNACHRSVLLTYVQIFRKPVLMGLQCNVEGISSPMSLPDIFSGNTLLGWVHNACSSYTVRQFSFLLPFVLLQFLFAV